MKYNKATISLCLAVTVCWVVPLTQAQNNEIFKNQIVQQMRDQGKQQMLPYHVLPVYGNASLGYYYVNIYVGSPDPQPQSVIIDTGSGILAVPCANCKQCGHKNHIHPPYDPQKSSSSKVLTCESTNPICVDRCRFKQKTQNCSFSIHYAEGSSLEGTLVEDDIRLETISKNQEIRTSFGCTQKQTKLFFQQKANGIFGLAPKRESNLLEQLFNRHSPLSGQKRVFSLCLSSNGGIMTVGGVNKKLHAQKTKPDISIPFNDNHNLYSLVGVREISIGEMFITSIMDRIGGYGIFIDSGSTFSYVPEAKYKQVQKLLNSTCVDSKRCEIGKGQDSICYKVKPNQGENLHTQLDQIFPPIEINVLNYRLKWPATRYMLIRNKNRNEVCMGLQPLNRYLLGANWMYNRDIVFDLNQKMIHIYDNVNCIESSSIMGQYLNEIQNNTELIYTTKQTQPTKIWIINTNSPAFILGVVCLILALLIAILLCLTNTSKKSKNRRAMIQVSQQQQEHGNKIGTEMTQVKSSDKVAQQEDYHS